jgi:hypothetical protein
MQSSFCFVPETIWMVRAARNAGAYVHRRKISHI